MGLSRLSFDFIASTHYVSWNMLPDGYMKIGYFADALELFDIMPERIVLSWTALINDLVPKDFFVDALVLFPEKQLSRIQPDHVIIVSPNCTPGGSVKQVTLATVLSPASRGTLIAMEDHHLDGVRSYCKRGDVFWFGEIRTFIVDPGGVMRTNHYELLYCPVTILEEFKYESNDGPFVAAESAEIDSKVLSTDDQAIELGTETDKEVVDGQSFEELNHLDKDKHDSDSHFESVTQGEDLPLDAAQFSSLGDAVKGSVTATNGIAAPPELFHLWKEELYCLVQGGVPIALRGELWQAFVGVIEERWVLTCGPVYVHWQSLSDISEDSYAAVINTLIKDVTDLNSVYYFAALMGLAYGFKDRGAFSMDRKFQRCLTSTSIMFLWTFALLLLTATHLDFQSFFTDTGRYLSSAAWGGINYEQQVHASSEIHCPNEFSVLVTEAAGFVDSHVLLALKKREDGVLALNTITGLIFSVKSSKHSHEGPKNMITLCSFKHSDNMSTIASDDHGLNVTFKHSGTCFITKEGEYILRFKKFQDRVPKVKDYTDECSLMTWQHDDQECKLIICSIISLGGMLMTWQHDDQE